jgi:RNA polymerase sigma-70 factor (ECF subfamily)
MRRNHYDGIDSRIVQLVRRKAHQISRQPGFSAEDKRDLEQDLFLDLYRRLPRFDPARASFSSFANLVVNHRAATILETHRAAKRNPGRVACSFDEPTATPSANGEGEQAELTREEHLYLADELRLADPTDADLAFDVQRAVASLPFDLQTLCCDLAYETPTQISRESQISRQSVYEHRKEILRHFENAGLRTYLGRRRQKQHHSGM